MNRTESGVICTVMQTESQVFLWVFLWITPNLVSAVSLSP